MEKVRKLVLVPIEEWEKLKGKKEMVKETISINQMYHPQAVMSHINQNLKKVKKINRVKKTNPKVQTPPKKQFTVISDLKNKKQNIKLQKKMVNYY